MPKFVLNRNQQANGDHEVHNATIGCNYMPVPASQIDLGTHSDCRGAVTVAKQTYPHWRINGCYYCCRACHTS